MHSNKKIESFEDLKVWQKGIQLVKQIDIITDEGKLSFGLKEQSTYSQLYNQARELSGMLFNQVQSINRASYT